MTITSMALTTTIPFTVQPFGAEGTWVGSHAYSEPADRLSDTDSRSNLVPLEVVDAARNGDTDSLARLCTLIHPRLIGFYRYSGLTADEAEDLSGDVSEDVITRLSSLRNANAFDAWMWSIGRNRLKGWIRVNRRPTRYEPANPSVAGPEELAIDADEHSRITGALSKLTERDRELLWLREVEGLTYGEIGGRFGAATGTIRVACHRARKRLERAYEREGD
jgi:RNA polymerase sigma-70 factor (ECF subfamily)